MINKTKTAVAYIRVSTDGQVDKYGLDAQKTDILEYCARNNYAVTRWYIEEGVSGVKEERPELDKILFDDSEVNNPPIEVVLVAASDRLSRDMNLYYYYKFLLRKKNIELVSVKEDFGSMGAFSGVMEAMALFFAERERVSIAKRTRAGRREKARSGGYSGGRSPYGYKVSGGQLEIDEKEAELVKKIFSMRDGGATFQDIADEINELGYRSRSNKRFYPSHIKAITDNRNVYEGMYKYGDDMVWVKGIHEPIIKVKNDGKNK